MYTEDEGKDGDNEFEVKAGPDLPFACFICRGPFINPIQTVCSHYFCQVYNIKKSFSLCFFSPPTLHFFACISIKCCYFEYMFV